MNAVMSHRSAIRLALIAAATFSLACTVQEAHEPAPPAAEAEQRVPTINHLTPARDSVGAKPTKFAWTAADGADRYAIGIWNDVDRLIWRDNHVSGTSVTLPNDIEMEFGTYFWMVTALRDGKPVAESGRSAFVVR
jgi:hypothetical protein